MHRLHIINLLWRGDGGGPVVVLRIAALVAPITQKDGHDHNNHYHYIIIITYIHTAINIHRIDITIKNSIIAQIVITTTANRVSHPLSS